jgi:lysophospholipase L1-like esterase
MEAAARLLPASSGPEPDRRQALKFDRNPELQEGNARFWEPDPLLFWRMRPGLDEDFGGMPLRTNAGGFRDGPHLPAQRRPLVICLGDSTTFGWGVLNEEARFSNQLAAMLADEAGMGPQVFNFGQSGYSTEQGRRLLEKEVLPLRPDAVVLLFGPNDYAQASSRSDADQPVADAGAASARAQSVFHHSAFYRRLAALLVSARDRAGRDSTADQDDNTGDRVLRRVSPDRFRANLQAMIQASLEAGTQPVLVTYPRRPLNPLLPCPVPSWEDASRLQAWQEQLTLTAAALQAEVTRILTRQGGSPEESLQRWRSLPAGLAGTPSFLYGEAYLLQQSGQSGEAEAILSRLESAEPAAACAPDLFSTRLFRYQEEPAVRHYNDIIRQVGQETGVRVVDTATLLAQAQQQFAAVKQGRTPSRTLLLGRWYGEASYFVDVVHPSARGHKLMATELARALTSEAD